MKNKYSDKELLDFLQKLNDRNLDSYSKECVLRLSTTGRGWRLHSHSDQNSFNNVRVAISFFMDNE